MLSLCLTFSPLASLFILPSHILLPFSLLSLFFPLLYSRVPFSSLTNFFLYYLLLKLGRKLLRRNKERDVVIKFFNINQLQKEWVQGRYTTFLTRVSLEILFRKIPGIDSERFSLFREKSAPFAEFQVIPVFFFFLEWFGTLKVFYFA